jgi:hypothetical protein
VQIVAGTKENCGKIFCQTKKNQISLFFFLFAKHAKIRELADFFKNKKI